MKEEIELDEFERLEAQIREEQTRVEKNVRPAEEYKSPQFNSSSLMSSDDEDEDDFGVSSWRKRLSTLDEEGEIGEGDEDDLEGLGSIGEHFDMLKKVRQNVLKSIAEDSDSASDTDSFLRLEKEAEEQAAAEAEEKKKAEAERARRFEEAKAREALILEELKKQKELEDAQRRHEEELQRRKEL